MLRMLGLFMVMPVIAVLATDYPGATPWLIGLAIGGYGLTQAVLQIPMGIWSDRWGRKPVIVIGLLCFAAGSLLAAYAESMWGLVLGRVLQGAGAIAGAVMALAADVSREQQRTKVMAIIGIAIGVSFYVALLLGPALAGQMGLKGLFQLTAVFALLAIVPVLFLVPRTQISAPSGDTLPNKSSIKLLLKQPALLRLNASVLLLHLLIASFFVQIPSILNQLQVPLSEHWHTYLPVLLISIFGLVVLMRLPLSQNALIKLCVLLLAGAFVGFAFHNNHYWLLFGASCVFFSGFNYLEANFPALVSTLSPAGQKGSAMGIFASFQFFGAFLGGLLSGYSHHLLGQQNALLLFAGLCLIWLLFTPRATGKTGVKRYTLSVNFDQHPFAQVQQKLAAIEGVKEVQVDIQQGAAYLKVEGQQFTLENAYNALATESS